MIESLNPLFIRSQFQSNNIPTLIADLYDPSQSLIHQVSVSERIGITKWRGSVLSQSLIHQVSVSETAVGVEPIKGAKKSQSLIHQVSVSEEEMKLKIATIAPFLSQSLIHQVSVSEHVVIHINL